MAPQLRFAGIGQKVEHIAVLHSKCGYHGKDAFNKPTAILAVSAETALSPKNCRTDSSFGGVICRFNAGYSHEGEERALEF